MLSPLELLSLPRGLIALVYKDFAGQGLESMLETPLSSEFFLRLARLMCTALASLHNQGIVHRELNPGCFLIANDLSQAKIRLSSLSDYVAHDLGQAKPRADIQGSLPYISPEQTGRIKQKVDARSDLYSLGLCFYEMLSGQKAFTADDPLEWIHCHIARIPKSLLEYGIPNILAKIVAKLLSKDPKERYQSAMSLRRDFMLCEDEWRARGTLENLDFDLDSIVESFKVSTKFYGRKAELNRISRSYNQVLEDGKTRIFMVSGHSGSGKSALVKSALQGLGAGVRFVAKSKFDQINRDVPYACLAEAINPMIQHILSLSKENVDEWREKIFRALGCNSQVMIDFIADLGLILGPVPPAPEIPLSEKEGQFQRVFRDFILVFAEASHPLIVFIDDLQWSDAASLRLIQTFLTDAKTQYVFFIGVYRSNQFEAAILWDNFCEEAIAKNIACERLETLPLSYLELQNLIADSLNKSLDSVGSLTDVIYEKTNGSPFFAVHFLAALNQDRLLFFDQDTLAWRWNLEAIRCEKFTDNVLDIVLRRLAHLPSSTQKLLKYAAAINFASSLDLLAELNQSTSESVYREIWPAIDEGLIHIAQGRYRFSHDRVQQAAYELTPLEQRPALHLEIGRVMLRSYDAGEQPELLFELLSQLNLGCWLNGDPKERRRLIQLNFDAALRAKSTAAYTSAAAYCDKAIGLLDFNADDEIESLAFTLHLEAAQCNRLAGKLAQAEEQLLALLPKAKVRLSQGKVYQALVELFITKGEMTQAISYCIAFCQLFGIELMQEASRELIDHEFAKIWQVLGGRPMEAILELPLIEDEGQILVFQVMAATIPPAVFTSESFTSILCCKMVQFCLDHGLTQDSPAAFVYFAMILGPFFDRYRDGYRFGKLAYELVEKRHLVASKARVLMIFGDVNNFWINHMASDLPYLLEAFRYAREVSDLTAACYCSNHILTCKMVMGEALDQVYRESEERLEFVRRAKYLDIEAIIISMQRFMLNMQGQTLNFSSFSDGAFDERAFEEKLEQSQMVLAKFWHKVLKIQARVISRDFSEALSEAQIAKNLIWSSPSHMQVPEYHFYFGLALAGHCQSLKVDERGELLVQLRAQRDQLKAWAEGCAENFANKYFLLAAELAWHEEDFLQAETFYDQAIQSAREHGFVQNLALAFEWAGNFYRERGLVFIADAYLMEAITAYDQWGARGKLKHLKESYPRLPQMQNLAYQDAFAATQETLDVLGVAKSVQVISQEVERDQLLKRLLRLATEQAGAERSKLILKKQDGSLSLEASADTVAGVLLQSEAINAIESLPHSVIHWVIRTQRYLILNQGSLDPRFASDQYFARQRHLSVCALPIMKQGKVSGVFLFENDLIAGVFSENRLPSLELIAAQTAISLENMQLIAQEKSARLEAERLNRVKDELLATVSHELRTPLNPILGWTTLLRDGLLEPEELPIAFESIERNIKTEVQLIDDLLDISAILTGKLSLHLLPIDPRIVLAQALETHALTMRTKNLELHQNLESTGHLVLADENRLRQVLWNVLGNACKFTPEGGRIDISLQTQGKSLEFKIKDSGIGMETQYLSSIFQSFSQVDSSMTRKFGGLGIGLSLAKQLIEAHGGEISAESGGLGQGSTFRIRIPILVGVHEP
ncbi:MAG: AAA family ATPase [Proteobacteria bacterium]|nr:AAA family ATPase [Pseudomonadota bacterium]